MSLTGLSLLHIYHQKQTLLETPPNAINIQEVATSTLEIPDISKTPPGQIAIRDKLLAILDPNDSGSVYAIVDAIQANKELSLSCHEIAHDIGHKAYELYGFSGAVNFSKSDPSEHRSVQDICAGGYIHGVLEEASLYQLDFKENPKAMCEHTSSDNRMNCFHGIGHALMFAHDRYLPLSLAGCRSVGHKTDTTRCFEGVWMELFWGQPQATSTPDLGWDTKHPLAPCIATDNDAKPACFLYSVFGYLRTHKKDYDGAIKLCTKSELDDSDSHFCMKGIGITMVSNFKGHNLERSEPFVDGLNENEKEGFYQGVLGYADLSGIYKADLESTCNLLLHDKEICKRVLKELN